MAITNIKKIGLLILIIVVILVINNYSISSNMNYVTEGFEVLDCNNIPENITEIRYDMLKHCKKISIPSSVTKIDDGALALSSTLEEITFKNKSTLNYIGSRAFIGSSLKSFTIPSSITIINDNTFRGTRLTSIFIPSSIISIKSMAFASCGNLEVIEFELRSSSIEINSTAFDQCRNIKSVINLPSNIPLTLFKDANNPSITTQIVTTQMPIAQVPTTQVPTTKMPNRPVLIDCNNIPENITVIKPDMLSHCKTISIPSSVISIGDSAFAFSYKLEQIIFNNQSNLTNIGPNAFISCSSLKSFTIPSSITIINDRTFQNTGLTSIFIPSSVISIKNYAFADCNSLNIIEFELRSTLIDIDSTAFNSCTKIKSVINLPNNISIKLFSDSINPSPSITTQMPTTQLPTTQVPTTKIYNNNIYDNIYDNDNLIDEIYNYKNKNKYIEEPTDQMPTTPSPYYPTMISSATFLPINTEIPIQIPTTQIPTTQIPTTQIPTDQMPTTQMPTTQMPTTQVPTDQIPTTQIPTTQVPTTQMPTTQVPTTQVPTTQMPTTQVPTIQMPTTQVPTTQMPTDQMPTDQMPTTPFPYYPTMISSATFSPIYREIPIQIPTTQIPTTQMPTDQMPTIQMPTIQMPTDQMPTTQVPTTQMPTDQMPTTQMPIDQMPTTPFPYYPTMISSATFSPIYREIPIQIPTTQIPIKVEIGCSNTNIPINTTTINDNTFKGCANLKTITIPSSVKLIGASAFEGCTNLESIIFEKNSQLISIGKDAFKGCNKIKTITNLPTKLPKNLLNILKNLVNKKQTINTKKVN